MGRLIGYMANRVDRLPEALAEEKLAIGETPSHAADAWGIGFYQGGEVLHKKRLHKCSCRYGRGRNQFVERDGIEARVFRSQEERIEAAVPRRVGLQKAIDAFSERGVHARSRAPTN